MWSNDKSWFKVLPAFVLITLLLFGGFFIGIMQSFGYWMWGTNSKISFSAYTLVWQSEDFWLSLGYSLRIVTISSVLSAIFGLCFVVFLYRFSLQRRWNELSFWNHIWRIPFWIPHLVAGYMVIFLFMQSGWFARVCYAFGWIEQPADFPILVNDRWGIGIILAYLWKEIPFIILFLLPVLYRIHEKWFEVGQMHGASVAPYIRTVVLPLLVPPLLIATWIQSAFMLAAYEIPYMIGVTYPKFIAVYGLEMYQSSQSIERQAGIVVYLYISVLTFLIGVSLYMYFQKWTKRWGRSW